MIFIVSTDPFGAVQLQARLKNANNPFVEVYLSPEETEQNLYKLPDVVLIDHNLELADILYLTQSIKAYDSNIQIIWMCDGECAELKKMHKSYGVSYCLSKEDYFLEKIALVAREAKEQSDQDANSLRRIEHLRKSIYSSQLNALSLN